MSDAAPIHVLQLTPQLSRGGGGAAAYLWGLASAARDCGLAFHMAGVADQWTEQDTRGKPAASIFSGRSILNPANALSLELRHYLDRDLPHVDLIHSHGLRTGVGPSALRVKRRRKIPLLITPHGLLYPDLLKRRPMKKWLVNQLWDDRYRAAADVFHATSDAEAQVIRASGATQPIAVVPIGVDLEQFNLPRDPPAEKKRLLFLGIMDRKKGLIRLAQAWGTLRHEFPDWELIIAGPDFDGHAAEVRAELARVRADDATTFAGAVYGQDKARIYRQANLFVLPTDWENFGIAIAEALASELPVITTRRTPWQELESRACGWWIEPTTVALVATLRQAMRLSDTQRAQMGRRGRQLIQERYAWPAIATQMRQLYEWMLGRRDRPAFVMPAAAS